MKTIEAMTETTGAPRLQLLPPLPLLPGAVDAAIIDLDGTMVHTLGDFSHAINRMLAQLQLPPVAEVDIGLMVGKGSEHLLRAVLAQALSQADSAGQHPHGLAPIEQRVDALSAPAWQAYEQHYLAINGQYASVYSGVVDGLQRLQALGLRLACLTNKPIAFARPLLEAKGLAGFFDHIFGGDSFAHKKPHPLPVLQTCLALGTLPARALMVGDSTNDAQAARAAGCPVVLVTYGYNHGQPVQAVDADGWVDSLADIAVAGATMSAS